MKKLTIIVSILIVANLFSAIGQEIEFDKESFRSKDNYKLAKGYVKDAESFYVFGKGAYPTALEHFLNAYKLHTENAALNCKIGNCYLYSMQKVKCIDYYKKAFELDPHVVDSIEYMLGRGYQLNMEFDKAIELFTLYKKHLSPQDLVKWRPRIDRSIAECNTGKELVANPVRVFIDNIGPEINGLFPEYSPLISADESMMIFTSKRDNTTGGTQSEIDHQYAEDIYVSYNDGTGWSPSENIGKPLNSTENDATVGLSSDGQELFIFKEGDLYKCELEGTEWSSPKSLPKSINTKYREVDASFSYNGKTMYFASEKPDNSFGGFDIYSSTLGEKGKWGDAINLGSVINTPSDDRSVFMHPDGRTIYFSSQGHKGMGGFDIFKSELKDDGTWAEPENLGYPINTPDDDIFFVMAASGKRGYFASIREDCYGNYDIYKITFRGPEKPVVQSNEDNLLANTAPVSEVVMETSVEIKTMRLTILKGTVKDALTLQPIVAEIELVDNDLNTVISVMKSNSATGKYLVSLPSGKNYGLAVKATDYLFHSENFNIPEATNYQEITKDILLNKMAVGSKIILKNIFFDYAKATLRPESNTELDRLVKLLTDFPSTRIEISGHTDNIGTLKLNTSLSENRAKAVVDYLVKNGIATERLEYKGYAYFQPIATNDTDAGRQENRRVEFKVLSN